MTLFRERENWSSVAFLVKTKLDCQVDVEILARSQYLATTAELDKELPSLNSLEVGTKYDLKEHEYGNYLR